MSVHDENIRMLSVGILYVTSKTVYGFTSRGNPLYLFVPLNPDDASMMIGSSVSDRSTNLLIVAEMIDTKNRIPRGVIMRNLGPCGNKKAEQEALLWRYCSTRWIPHTILEPRKNPLRKRLDVPTVNIDPDGCVDIDDCISIWNDGNVIHVAITIADVHAWILENPHLIESASTIGQTYYADGKVVHPMLPRELSEDQCSLIPGKERLGYALLAKWNGVALYETSFAPVTILNKKSYTYDTICGATDFPVDTLRDIASSLAGKPENDPHKWIEHLMIFYNVQAANQLKHAVVNRGIYRGHSAPDVDRLEQYKLFGADVEKLAYSAAIYSDTPIPHWGLGLDAYCHATSPIRRWADIVNQGALKGHPVTFDCGVLNKAFTHSKKYERDMFFLEALMNDPVPLVGRVLDSTGLRSRVWVPQWKRIITVRSIFPEGTQLSIQYFLNMAEPTWKRRIIFRCEDIGYPEPPHP